MILADEYEELEKEREVFAQENKFSKTKSASPHAEDARRQITRVHEEMTNGHHHTKPDDSRQQTHHAEAIGHHPHICVSSCSWYRNTFFNSYQISGKGNCLGVVFHQSTAPPSRITGIVCTSASLFMPYPVAHSSILLNSKELVVPW